MITHGNKQISEIVYARKASEGGGAVRLTNIIRGAQVVFGGMYPLWRLCDSTKAAILAAFGVVDGKAVIKATNAYLNALAATDPTKASALAGFINEDPMLVCSLGLQPQGVTMPIRKLVGDGFAYLHINVEITTLDRYKIEIENRETSYTFHPFFDTETYAMACWLSSSSAVTTLTGSESGQFSCPKGNHIFEKVGSVWYVDGVQKQSKSLSEITYSGFWLFSWSKDKSRVNKGAMKKAIIGDEGNEKFVGFPFIRQGANGMIDTITGTFYPNANTQGSFTIEYTLPDGTPWTPLNQTP